MAFTSTRLMPELENTVITDLREYHRQRRQLAKRAGICIQCSTDPAAEGRSKCPQCLMIEASRRPRVQRFRFNASDRAEILHRYAQGESEEAIAATHGCHRSTIHRVLTKARQPLRRAA